MFYCTLSDLTFLRLMSWRLFLPQSLWLHLKLGGALPFETGTINGSFRTGHYHLSVWAVILRINRVLPTFCVDILSYLASGSKGQAPGDFSNIQPALKCSDSVKKFMLQASCFKSNQTKPSCNVIKHSSKLAEEWGKRHNIVASDPFMDIGLETKKIASHQKHLR